MIESYLFVEPGIHLGEKSVVALRADAGKANDLVLLVRLVRLINLNINLASVLEIVPAVIVIQLAVLLVAEALLSSLIDPLSRQPTVG